MEITCISYSPAETSGIVQVSPDAAVRLSTVQSSRLKHPEALCIDGVWFKAVVNPSLTTDLMMTVISECSATMTVGTDSDIGGMDFDATLELKADA